MRYHLSAWLSRSWVRPFLSVVCDSWLRGSSATSSRPWWISRAESWLSGASWGEWSLLEPLASVGSEVGPLRRWQDRDERLAAGAFERALELLDLTLADTLWRMRWRREPPAEYGPRSAPYSGTVTQGRPIRGGERHRQ